jgi:nucleotide-binding universal stress UspA family protein
MKVLIPTDFSVQAEYAYTMVKKLAEKMEMQITFLHVMSVPETVSLNVMGEIETCGEIDVDFVSMQRDIAMRKLTDLKTSLGNVETDLVFGKVTSGVVDYADQNKFDLIVMGTKGASGLKEIFSGSEAQMIARKSNVPLLTLMCDRSDLQLQHILLVHDFSEQSNEDLSLLKKFMEVFNTKVHFLQICKDEHIEEHNEIRMNMKAYAQKHGINSYEAHILKDNDVEEGVIHFNQMNNMDLVCIGTHGKSHLFHSSASERLVNHMFKPLITFKIK